MGKRSWNEKTSCRAYGAVFVGNGKVETSIYGPGIFKIRLNDLYINSDVCSKDLIVIFID